MGGAGAGGVAIKFFAGPGGKRGGEYLRGATAGKRGGELRGRAYAEPGGRRRGQSSRQGQGGVAANILGGAWEEAWRRTFRVGFGWDVWGFANIAFFDTPRRIA